MFTPEDANTISRLIANPDMAVDVAWLEELMREYPTFAFAAALLLARNPESIEPDQRKELQAQMMLNACDHAAFADLSDLSGDKWADFVVHPAKKEQKSTADTIDTFLGTFSMSTPAEDALLEKMIFNPVTEYQLEADLPASQNPEVKSEPNPPSSEAPQCSTSLSSRHDASQAESDPTPPPFVPPVPLKKEEDHAPKTKESTLMMESLAKIFIKQHRYERAFVIINNLILKYPEKSVYFADQLRFLQKLIINSKYKTK